jgi:hypothetical protein
MIHGTYNVKLIPTHYSEDKPQNKFNTVTVYDMWRRSWLY